MLALSTIVTTASKGNSWSRKYSKFKMLRFKPCISLWTGMTISIESVHRSLSGCFPVRESMTAMTAMTAMLRKLAERQLHATLDLGDWRFRD